ncbi:MAG: SGNH/GDSL hydrolase family protein [Candidatus Acidiferrales bacterium]
MRFISSTLFSIAAAMASFGLLFAVPPGARAAARQTSSSLSAAPPPAPLSTSAELAAASERVAKMEHTLADWPDLAKYRDANAALAAPSGSEKRVVFMGDSITESWGSADPQFFAAHAYIDRGISGQTTPQMLVRFRQDVIALRPAVVVILAGTNDIAGNTGPTSIEAIEGNLESMAELARASGIRVVLSSVLPVFDYPWRRGLQPAPKIAALNSWIKDYCGKARCVYLDYFSAMADERQGLPAALSLDGVHPNQAGFAIMEPLAEAAIAKALARQ